MLLVGLQRQALGRRLFFLPKSVALRRKILPRSKIKLFCFYSKCSPDAVTRIIVQSCTCPATLAVESAAISTDTPGITIPAVDAKPLTSVS